MVTINTIYDLYILYNQKEIEEIEKEITSIKRQITTIKNVLIKHQDILGDKVNMSNLLLGKVSGIPAIHCRTQKDKWLDIQIKLYYKLFCNIPERERTIKTIQDNIVPFKVFKYIVHRYNDLLLTEVIERRYKFFHPNFGTLFARLNIGKKKTVNWGASHANKKRLLEEGKIPYYKKEEEEAKRQGIEYKGEPWIEYIGNTTHIYLYWNTTFNNICNTIKGIRDYNFFASKGERGVLNKLASFRKTLSDEQLALYKYD